MLVATKIDDTVNRVISSETGLKYAKINNMIYIETSSLTNLNVNEAFL